MRKLSQKLFLSVLAVTLAVIALGTTTFAWFTMNNKAEVTQIEGELIAGEGFEISLNGTDYYSTISNDIMKNYLSGKYSGENALKLDTVTSTNGTTMKKMDGSNAAANSFIEFTLYFRSRDGRVITWDKATLGGDGVAWTSDVAFTSAKGSAVASNTPGTYYAKDAARVSLTGGTSGAPVTVVYEEADSASNAYLGGVTDEDFTTAAYDKGGISYFKAKTGLALGAAYQNINLVDTQSADLATKTNLIALAKEGSAEYHTASVVVRIWIEGWDLNAFNPILKSKLTVKLEFKSI